MPSKPRVTNAFKDDLVWEKLDERIDEWLETVKTSDVYRSVANFILEHKPGKAVEMHRAIKGGYNICYRLEYDDGSSVIMRVPIKDVVPLPLQDEKVLYEVAVMRYVEAHTSIPVPHVYHYGMAADNPLGLGPFIIMSYIEHHDNLSSILRDPDRPVDKYPVLNPNIDETCLKSVYEQVADILLQLDGLRFPRIGSLVQDKTSGEIAVKGRPLLSNMIDLFIHTDAPAEAEGILPATDTTYTEPDAWFSAMARVHMAQFVFQCRDNVEDDDDARDKYVARQLFRQVTEQGNYAPATGSASDPKTSIFSLYSEDLRPANILIDKDGRIVGVIDWEFVYAAPLSFTSSPPWWLLMEEPESWSPGGLDGWMETYEPRLQTFLVALEAVEKNRPATEEPLSQRMRTSWATKDWLRSYAARRSWAFDFMWWKHLDEQFFGPNEDQDHKTRLSLLSDAQRNVIEELVEQKLKDGQETEIRTLQKEEAETCLAKYLV